MSVAGRMKINTRALPFSIFPCRSLQLCRMDISIDLIGKAGTVFKIRNCKAMIFFCKILCIKYVTVNRPSFCSHRCIMICNPYVTHTQLLRIVHMRCHRHAWLKTRMQMHMHCMVCVFLLIFHHNISLAVSAYYTANHRRNGVN